MTREETVWSKVKTLVLTKSETIDSAVSYTVGFGGITLASVLDAAQNITILAGCAIVLLRLLYDAIKLFRYIKDNK